MPITTITQGGRKRYRWTFNRIIKGNRVRQTKVLPAGISAAEADSLGRKWEAEIYAIESGERKPVVTIGECVRKHVADKAAGWKDAEKRILVLEKWGKQYAEQDATDLHKWSIEFVGFLRSHSWDGFIEKKPLSDGSIKNIMSYLRAAIRYAHKVKMIDVNDTSRMSIPSVSNDRHNYPQRREMVLIARKCPNRRVRAVVRVAFYSGMRRSEILRAKISKKGWQLDDSKNGKPRIIPIHPKVAVIARRIKLDVNPNTFSHDFAKARVAAGFPSTRFHDLRHGAASEMINAGVNIFTVGGVLGHKSVVSTKRYAHLVTDKLSDAVGKIGKRK